MFLQPLDLSEHSIRPSQCYSPRERITAPESCLYYIIMVRTALMLSLEAARFITNTLPLIGVLLMALKNGRDLSAPFEINLLSAGFVYVREVHTHSPTPVAFLDHDWVSHPHLILDFSLCFVLKGFPPTMMVLGIPVISAVFTINNDPFLCVYTAKNIFCIPCNAFLDLLMSLFDFVRTSTKLPMLMMSSVAFDFKSALQHESSL
ncbi:hypothetical protein Tco_1457120 [Tanacetum coccineum]